MQFGQEAQDWAMRVLGDITYAKYFELAQGRTEEDAIEMLRRRTWRIRLSRIAYTNMQDENDLFLTFAFGYDFRVTRKMIKVKEEAPKAKGGSAAPPGGAKPKLKWKWVTKGGFGVVSMTRVCLSVSKGSTCEFSDAFDFVWTGSYFDLYRKTLHMEVWDWNSLAPNKFLASHDRVLRDIVLDSMDQRWPIFSEVRKRGKVALVQDGEVAFQLVFQEVLEYTVKLSNWSATLNPFLFLPQLEEGDDPVDVLPAATFCLHSPSLPFWSSKRSRSTRIKSSVSPKQQWLKIDFGQLSSLHYKGTRSDFEAGLLYVSIHDKGSLLNGALMGRAAIPLKSVMETGTLSSTLSLPNRAQGQFVASVVDTFVGPRTRAFTTIMGVRLANLGRAMRRGLTQLTGRVSKPADEPARKPAGSTAPRNAGFISGSLAVDVIVQPSPLDRLMRFAPSSAKMWREFAQQGEPNPPELRDYPPYNYSYLCVKVVQARNLIVCDPGGTSDPYVTVQWGDQRLRTRVLRETLDPVFNEDLYFLVRSFDTAHPQAHELASVPVVQFLMWDYDDCGSSELMGVADVYLHDLTGCGAGGDPVTLPTSRVHVRCRQYMGAPLKSATITTRVLKRTLSLTGLPRGVESSLQVEMYFRGPRGDLVEKDAWTQEVTGSDLVVLPPLQSVYDDLQTSCLCEPVARFARADEMRAPHKLDSRGALPLERKMCELSRTPGHICARLERFDARLAKASEHVQAVVGSFCVHADVDCAHFLAKDQFGRRHWLPQFLQPITPPRHMIFPDEAKYMVLRSSQKPNSCFLAAQMVRAIEFCALDEAKTALMDSASWLTPDFFLAMRKGDVKAHCLLLCSVLLGLMTDAYVCLGFARPEPAHELVLQIREKARKESWSTAKKRAAFAALRGEPRPYVWVMTRESSSEMYGPRYAVERYGGAVKFWDVTRGAYYPPLPNRWEGQDDAALWKQSMQPEQRRRRKAKKAGPVFVGVQAAEDKDAAKLVPALQMMPQEEDLLEGGQMGNDVAVDVDDVFALGAGTGDMWGEPEAGGNVDDDDDGGADEAADQAGAGTRNEAHERRVKFILGRKQREREGRIRERMPFTKLVAVFNHKNLWVNVHKHQGPCDVSFDFELGEAGGWLPVLADEEARVVQSFFPARNLGPKLTEDRVASLRHGIAEELEAGLYNLRSSHNVPTRFAGRDMNALVSKLVQAKHELEALDKTRANGFDADARQWLPGSEGEARALLYDALLKTVLRTVPPGFSFRIGFAKLSTTDPVEVRKVVLAHAWTRGEPAAPGHDPNASWVESVLKGRERDPIQKDRVSIHEENHGGREMFALGVCVVPYANQTNVVRVALIVVFPTPDEAALAVAPTRAVVASV